jgi:hypothetical protein
MKEFLSFIAYLLSLPRFLLVLRKAMLYSCVRADETWYTPATPLKFEIQFGKFKVQNLMGCLVFSVEVPCRMLNERHASIISIY